MGVFIQIEFIHYNATISTMDIIGSAQDKDVNIRIICIGNYSWVSLVLYDATVNIQW